MNRALYVVGEEGTLRLSDCSWLCPWGSAPVLARASSRAERLLAPPSAQLPQRRASALAMSQTCSGDPERALNLGKVTQEASGSGLESGLPPPKLTFFSESCSISAAAPVPLDVPTQQGGGWRREAHGFSSEESCHCDVPGRKASRDAAPGLFPAAPLCSTLSAQATPSTLCSWPGRVPTEAAALAAGFGGPLTPLEPERERAQWAGPLPCTWPT